MGGQGDLEARVRVLEDIEGIRKLKARYWRTLDRKLWDELAECFTDDFVLEAPPDLTVKGQKEFINYLKGMFDRPTIVTTHQGHQAEIEITSETAATAIWALRDNHVDAETKTVMRGRGHYQDEYVKENGRWKIRRTILTYLLHEQELRSFGLAHQQVEPESSGSRH